MGRLVGVYLEIGVGADEGEGQLDLAAKAIIGELAEPRYAGLFDGRLGNIFLKVKDLAAARVFRRHSQLPIVVGIDCRGIAALEAVDFDAITVTRESLLADPECVARAHGRGVLVHAEALAEDPVGHALMLSRGVDAMIATHPNVSKAVRDSYYPLLVSARRADVQWQFAAPGQVTLIDFEVSNPFGGPGTTGWMAMLLEFRMMRLPRCTLDADLETVAHRPLQLRVRRIGAERLQIELRLPEEKFTCFSGTALLRDGTRVEVLFRTG